MSEPDGELRTSRPLSAARARPRADRTSTGATLAVPAEDPTCGRYLRGDSTRRTLSNVRVARNDNRLAAEPAMRDQAFEAAGNRFTRTSRNL